MLTRFEGERPPDASVWLDVLCEALGEEAGSSWVRFYRAPGGWRFDLECRRESGASGPNGEVAGVRVWGSRPSLAPADESVALRVYTLLVESGKPLDPGWRPFAPSPPVAIVRTPALVVAPAASPVAEAATVPLGEAPPPAAVLEPEPPSEPQPPPAFRPTGWRGLRPAIVYLPAVLLVALAGWLSRDLLRSRPASPLVPTPSATLSQEALTAQKRLMELEAVVAQLKQERAQGVPGRRPATPAPIGARQQAFGLAPTQRADKILAPTPVPGPTATPAPSNVPLPTDPPISTDADATTAPVPAAAAEPPPTPSPVQREAMVDANDPGFTPPVPVTQTQPRFPPLALARQLSGTVWLKAMVDETGAVVEVSLVRVSPGGLDFEGEATKWLRTRVYRPATAEGVPVRAWVTVKVEFRHPDR